MRAVAVVEGQMDRPLRVSFCSEQAGKCSGVRGSQGQKLMHTNTHKHTHIMKTHTHTLKERESDSIRTVAVVEGQVDSSLRLDACLLVLGARGEVQGGAGQPRAETHKAPGPVGTLHLNLPIPRAELFESAWGPGLA